LLTPAAAAEPPPLSLHDALPISRTIATTSALRRGGVRPSACRLRPWHGRRPELRRPELLPRGRRLHSLRRRGLGDRPWLRAKHLHFRLPRRALAAAAAGPAHRRCAGAPLDLRQ